jgi:dolichol-phosphate mannosyltransferase
MESALTENASVISDTRSAPLPGSISFLIPVYNEVSHIEALLKKMASLALPKELVIVDDGSTDGTRDILRREKISGAAVIFHKQNGGKGRAIQTALAAARGEFSAIQDADLEYDPEEYLALFARMKETRADLVLGSRFLIPNPTIYKTYYLGNKTLTRLINLVCGSRYTDSYTCYKLLRTELFRSLQIQSGGFEMEAEMTVKAAMRGFKIEECPIHYAPRAHEQGKKINWKDGVKGILTILRVWSAEKRRQNEG